MSKESVLIVGLGEVGHSLFDLFTKCGEFDVYGVDVDKGKMRSIVGEERTLQKVDFMHICFPCVRQDEFVRTTLLYMKKNQPGLTTINSTVPPGTTRRIYESAKTPLVHSPIRGMHANLEAMKKDITFWSKYVGGITKEAADAAREHFEKLGLKVKILRGPEETELAKLFETTYRAWMIACFQEMHRISRHFGADFSETVDMLEDIHRVRFNKPLHYPAVIGGHCLIPNTELLLGAYDSEFLRLVLRSNEKRKAEIKDKEVFEETERVRRKSENLQKELMKKLETGN